jgi:hypothetical protein
MQKKRLIDSGARGWFIGDFPEAVVCTKAFEVNWQRNPAGPSPTHVHKIVTEVQLVTRGRLVVNDVVFETGDICILEPGEIGKMEFLEETDTVCVKFPSIPDDKYLL